MRITVDHRTQYRFSEPQARIVQMLRMTPCDTQEQTVVAWRIDVDCDVRLRDARDGFGNAVTMLYADGPIEALDITVTGEVLTLGSDGVVRGAPEPLPPALYLRETMRTRGEGELADFAARVTGGASDTLDALHRLNVALGKRFALTPAGRDHGFSAGAVFLTEHASARDLAQMFVAAARSRAVPARYVTGYRSTDCCSAHAWAEAYVAGLGWVAFDPAAGICADEHYVRVAVGLDASGAAAIVGQRIGQGEEALEVDLHIGPYGGDA